MANNETNKDQLPLPIDAEPIEFRHDYGGQYDDGDVGHEYPFGQEIPREPDGITVSLQERADTLERAAKIYADYNKLTIGLGKAVNIPAVLAELEERYGIDQVPTVVAGARNNSFYQATGSELDFQNPPLELRMLDGVLKYSDALAAGANPTELSAELQPLVVGIRHAIGTKLHGVDAKKRNAEIKKVKATAARAARYSS